MDVYKPRLSHVVWNTFSLLLSFFIVIVLIVEYFLKTDPNLSALILLIDKAVCAVFFVEFLVKFFTARNKWRYLKWGWVDLLASIPITWFRLARLLKIIVILRLLFVLRRFFKVAKIFKLRYSPEDIAGLVFLFFILCLTLVMATTSILILYFEEGKAGGIQTPLEALWWTSVTITTVGYGDYVPITIGGRVVALVLMVLGIGLFSTLTAYISAFILKLFSRREEGPRVVMTGEELAGELRYIRKQLKNIERIERKREARTKDKTGDKTGDKIGD